MDFDSLDEQYDEGYMPLDEAVTLMAHGFDMNEFEGYSLIDLPFDPYFED
jgi:hypothetical protein